MPEHTLLFVDDEENIQRSLQRVFHREGYNILTASNGKEGLEKIAQNKVDLILSDHKMPQMTGVEFLKEAKKTSPDTVRIILTGYADAQAAMDAINKGEVYRYITKPWNDEDLKITVKRALQQYDLTIENRRLNELTKRQNEELQELNRDLEERVHRRTQEIREKNEELSKLYGNLERNFLDSIRAFASLVELRDTYTGSHSKRVAAFARSIAAEWGLEEREVLNVEIAAILHDIGKIGIPDRLLAKPYEEMGKEEKRTYEQHPIIGQASIQVIENLQQVGVLIRHHHENWDGSGYPDGLKEDSIPLGSRIISPVDAYDTLVNRRGYSQKITKFQAREKLKSERGIKFDPEVVNIFLELLEAKEATSQERVEIRLALGQLKEGMVLSRDLYTSRGILLIPKEEVIRPAHIDKILNYHRIDPIVGGVWVYKPGAEV